MDWGLFYDYADGAQPQRARRIDTVISAPLYEMPNPPPPDTRRSLAERNLLRGSRVGLPSGQDVARAMGVTPLTNAELGIPDDPGWRAPGAAVVLRPQGGRAPRGCRPVGAGRRSHRGEVLVKLLAFDKNSYLNKKANFRPEPPIAPERGRFTLPDLVRFAKGT